MKKKLAAFLLPILLHMIHLLPHSWVDPLSRMFGKLAPRLLKRDRALIQANVRRVYGLAAHSSYMQRFQQQVFTSQAAVMLETFKTNLKKNGRTPLTIDGMDALEVFLKDAAQGQGTIIVSAHLGSWEMVARCIAQASGRRFYALAKPSKLPAFTKVLSQALRAHMNTDVLWTDSKNLLRDMIKVLKGGDYLGFVMDQKPEGRVGPMVQFMGSPTEFVGGPAKLAIRHQCPIYAVFCMRTGPWRYRIHSEVIAPAHHGLADEQALTQAMADAIEACIRLYPEQWVWNYKRWRPIKTVPGAIASSSRA